MEPAGPTEPETTIKLTTEFIKLDALLKVIGVANSGGQAKHVIQELSWLHWTVHLGMS